jgi:hypothetical protein
MRAKSPVAKRERAETRGRVAITLSPQVTLRLIYVNCKARRELLGS